ncbi:MAG TPA: zinc-dependent metalloprotease family protein [Bacteroidia bacterium]|jgi:hypothetical protein|nr:zinc-dependent metalloprotease family protein [Bacteroidia bacterium]
MKKITLFTFIIAFAGSAIAQNGNRYWSPSNESAIRSAGERTIIPQKYAAFHMEEAAFKAALFAAPHEDNYHIRNSSYIIELPMPTGEFQKFKVVEAPIMAPELAAQFPEIKTFSIEGIDDPYAHGKLDWTAFGFHAMVLTPSGDLFIDPYSRGTTSDYISYYVADFRKAPQDIMKETGVRNSNPATLRLNSSTGNRAMICSGTQLRKYRLALACTGEYAKKATGKTSPTTNEILSVVTTSVNRVDGIYETEAAIRMVLISNETSILFGNPTTDPFNGNDDADTLIDESQSKITSIIGTANFDIGHTFSTGGGGLADLGCVCNAATKASGITGSSNPVGDAYDVDYVAHEMGHQFGGNHTFASATGACSGNGNSATRVEPGSGITIMAYAGICDANDIAPHSIAYFHTISFDEIMKFSTVNGGNSCPVTTATTNHPPSVTIPAATYNIPFSTPFTLTGSATDADNDSLTYSWEESESGPQADWNAGSKPFFRSYNPVKSPSRTFPLPSIVAAGPSAYQTTIGEYLPSDKQTLTFRLTARDNKMGGGGVCYASTTIAIANAGPFQVTAPNTTGIIWPAGATRTVTWDVNKTDLTPISCANVNILVSIDGGTTFTTLLANTPNDGTQDITVPMVPTTKTTCRIRVESVGNVFFDVNDKDFTITSTNGIQNFLAENMNLQLIPNPAADQVQINLSGLNKNLTTQLRVVDMLGNVILTDVFNGKEQINQNYDLSILAKGVYLVEIKNEQQQAVSRLMKQ